jgi:hypothetical protein
MPHLVGFDPTPAEFDGCVERLTAIIAAADPPNSAALLALGGAEDPRALDAYLLVAERHGRDLAAAFGVIVAINGLANLFHGARLSEAQREQAQSTLSALADDGVGHDTSGHTVRWYARNALRVATD